MPLIKLVPEVSVNVVALRLPLVKLPPFIVKAPTVCVVLFKSIVPVLLKESALVLLPRAPASAVFKVPVPLIKFVPV